MDNQDLTPLTVLVTEDRWDAIGELTTRNILLSQQLTEIGGVSEGTPPGTYLFNMEMMDSVHAVFSLELAE